MLATIPPEEKSRLIALGSEGMKREIAEGKHCAPTSPYRDAVDALLASVEASENSAALYRAEARESEAIKVAREANAIARDSNTIALAASSLAADSNRIALSAKEDNRRALWVSSLISAIVAVITTLITVKWGK